MKKLLFATVLMFSVICLANSQVTNKAIGLRFGGGFSYGAEISYQHPLGKANRLEFDLGLNGAGFGLSGLYHWVWDLSSLAQGFNWYAGVGAGIGSYNFAYSTNKQADKIVSACVLGQIGIEFAFEIPLTISLDYRPGLYFSNAFNSSVDGLCAAARYRF